MALCVALCAGGCVEDEAQGDGAGGERAVDMGGDLGLRLDVGLGLDLGLDAELPDAELPDAAPRPVLEGWCAQVMPGAAGDEGLEALVALHGDVRFFGVHSGYAAVDDALSEALEAGWRRPHLDLYAEASEAICALSAGEAELGEATVSMDGDVAVVRPGVGWPGLPEGAAAVVLDLRELPASPQLDRALEATLSALLDEPLPRATAQVRQHNGMIDEVFSAENIFFMDLGRVQPRPWSGFAERARPLAVLTGPRMAPVAAELAGALRLDGRAWLLGPDVSASVAESRWRAVGGEGIAWRDRDLMWAGERWPDAIKSDDPVASVLGAKALMARAEGPGPLAMTPASRPSVALFDPRPGGHAVAISPGQVRAALVTALGAAERFFAYWPRVEAQAWTRLHELMADSEVAAEGGRRAAQQIIGRLGNALEDGHTFTNDTAPDETSIYADVVGFALAEFDAAEGAPWVVRSAEPDLSPGDRVLAIDGVPVEARLSEILAVRSAATPGNHRQLAIPDLLQYLRGQITLSVEDLEGETRLVELTPHPREAFVAFDAERPVREAGWVDVPGAEDLYYVNLDMAAIEDGAALLPIIAEASEASGVILDMRGYPGVILTPILNWLLGGYDSPEYRLPRWTGADRRDWVPRGRQIPASPTIEVYEGSVVLLVGPGSQSAAEDFSIPLVARERVTVVGRQSSGSDGNITGLNLPGGFTLTFTGLEVRYPGGAEFHGVGIRPDVEVEIAGQDLAEGVDRAVVTAVERLLGGQAP